MRDVRPKIAIVVVMVIAVVRAATGSAAGATPSTVQKPMSAAVARDVYRDVTSRERMMRRDAVVKFPGDIWSQDDDFHERENEAVRSLATSREVSVTDVVRAVDDGMHQHWPAGGTPQATVPPCRPRLSY